VLEIVAPGRKPVEITARELLNGDGEAITATPHPNMAFSMPCEQELAPMTILRRKK